MLTASVPESPFATMLGTNHTPSEDEIAAIKKYLVNPAAEAAALNKDIDEMQTTLKGLQEKRDALSHAIGLHEALISPLRRYPDILQEIFHHCLPAAHDATMKSSEAPLLLTHICRDWRHLALSTPSLWSSILIHQLKCLPQEGGFAEEVDPQLLRVQEQTCAAGVQEWLSRSGACPISISFLESALGSEEGPCQPFLNAIRPFALRWRRLVLRGRAKPDLDQFLSLLSTEVPILEELVVSFETPAPAMNSDSDDNRWSRCGIIRAPRLKRVVIANLNESIAVLQLHWSQMTHLSFEHNKAGRDMSLSANETIEILRQCPNLVSIQVEIGDIESPGVDMDQIAPAPVHSREVVVMHHLLHLTIHTALDLSEFFPVIQTPVLREFSFFGIPLPALGIPSVISFLSWVPTLKRLSIDPRCFTLEQLSQCLASCPMITSLRFCTGFVKDGWYRTSFSRGGSAKCDATTIASITPSSEDADRDEYLCRYLREFYATRAHFTADSVYNFITARQRRAQNGYPKLEAVSVQFSNYQNWDLLDTLRDVDGFKLTANKPAPSPTEEEPVVRALASIEKYPRNAITAEPGAFDQRDIKMFSVPIY